MEPFLLALVRYNIEPVRDFDQSFPGVEHTGGSAHSAIPASLCAKQRRASGAAVLRWQQAAHDLLISNQVSKGFEQLAVGRGNEHVSEYYQSVLEALRAFVRDSTAGKTVGDHPATDIQAVLTVIARRSPEPGDADLVKANIPGTHLGGATLNVANLLYGFLNGAASFGAYLISARLVSAHPGRRRPVERCPE